MTTSADADPPSVDPVAVTAVRAIMNASDALRNACARYYGLTQSDVLAMSHLAAVGNMTASDLAERLRMSGASVTSVADRLEKAGLARRGPHESDRRMVVLEITELGRTRITALRVLVTRAMAGLADPEQVASTLVEVAARLEAQVAHVGRTLDALAAGPAG